MGFNHPEQPCLGSLSPWSWSRCSSWAQGLVNALQPGLLRCCLGFLDWPEIWLVPSLHLLNVGWSLAPFRYCGNCDWQYRVILRAHHCPHKGDLPEKGVFKGGWMYVNKWKWEGIFVLMWRITEESKKKLKYLETFCCWVNRKWEAAETDNSREKFSKDSDRAG